MRIRAALVAALCLLAGCGEAMDRPGTLPGDDVARARYVAASDRLLERFTDLGQVVSRGPGSKPERVGEALIWTGTAMANLGCGDGYQLTRLFLARLRSFQGALFRYVPLPEEYFPGNEVSLDGELGWWWGAAARARRCPEELPEFAEAWALRAAYLERTGGRLHANVEQTVPAPLDAARDQVAHALGLRGAPSQDRLDALGYGLAGWAASVAAVRAPAYRINLAFTTIRAVEASGGTIGDGARNAFCGATAGVDIPTVDHWCGRPALSAFVDGFQHDVWEYRHQRSGAWETPDAAGFETPGLDLIVALRELHGETLEDPL